jgi:predicted dinucleotide-binding enzyme
MKIAVMGMGKVGGVLGRRWAQAGHAVMFGVRDPDNPMKQADARAAGASVAAVRQAAADAEVVLLAVLWRAVPDVVMEAGGLAGKVLLNCTNPLMPDFFGLTVGTTDSAGGQVARMAPGARVVKVFNTNGAANMANPDYGSPRVSMLYAGDDPAAKAVAARLATDLGLEPIELGPLWAWRLLEPLAVTWIVLSRQRGFGVDFALNVVRRPSGWRPSARSTDEGMSGRQLIPARPAFVRARALVTWVPRPSGRRDPGWQGPVGQGGRPGPACRTPWIA